MNDISAGSERRVAWRGADVALLVATLLIFASYMLLRYGGRWGEGDTMSFVNMTQAMLAGERLVPASGEIYANGYGYPALSAFSLVLGGVTVSQFQWYLSLFLMPWIVLPAWMLYRELTGSPRGATLATVILLVQPEFLFPLMRGTHEKFTRGLILIALYLFVKSIGKRHPLPRAAAYILAFYFATYGAIAFNNFLASSFLMGLLLALVLLAVLRWLRRSDGAADPAAERRLRYAIITSTLILFLFTFFFYTPARHYIYMLENMAERLAALLLDVEGSASSLENPYAYTAGAWISTPVYFMLTVANWALLVASAAIWLWRSLAMLRHRKRTWPADWLVLWALYGAFAIQGALSMLSDRAGGLATNLQLRAFPTFAMLAAPLVARVIVEHGGTGTRDRKMWWKALLVLLGLMAALSVLKASNEPLVSNNWMFWIPAEMRALDRAEVMLTDRFVWTDFDGRLILARAQLDPAASSTGRLTSRHRSGAARDILVSDVIEARGERISANPPIEADSLITYDNGQAQLYHLRPRTPFQR